MNKLPQLVIESRNRLALLCLSMLVITSFSPFESTAQCGDCVFPGAAWEMIQDESLADLGWSEDALRAVSVHLRDNSHATGVVVIDRGHLVFEFGDTAELSYIASVRKSILALLFGSWVQDGTIDLDLTLEQIGVDDIGGLLPIERQATVRQLITARSGVYHPASNDGDNLADAPPRGTQEPGSYMLYNNWDFNAAGAIFEQLTGRNIYEELEAQLAIPLEFEDWDRSAQRKTGDLSISQNPAYHMWISTRDMARIGHLMLNEGNWNGEKLISSNWVNTITEAVTPLEEMNPIQNRDRYFGYGYMWWVWDGPTATGPFEGAYTGRGAYGQWITVFPAIDLVISHKTKYAYRRVTSWESWHRMIELLFDANNVSMAGPYPWE
jgi:CubicO group peptidase (beta-lactamase class C family)